MEHKMTQRATKNPNKNPNWTQMEIKECKCRCVSKLIFMNL